MTSAAPAPHAPTPAPVAVPTTVLPLSPRRDLLGRLAFAAVLNVLVALVVSRGLAAFALPLPSVLGTVALGLAWLSTLVSFLAILLVVLIPPVAAWPQRWLLVGTIIVGFGLFQVALLGDVVIYQLFRMHYNLMIWDVLTTPAAGDSVTLGRGTIIAITLSVLGIVAAEVGIAWIVLRQAMERLLRLRTLIIGIVVVVAIVVCDKLLYAWGDLMDRSDVTRVERYFPLYQRTTARRWAIRHGLIEGRRDDVVIRSADSGLRYPRAEIPPPSTPNRLNIVVLVIEGCRFDVLTPEIMPNLHAFAQRHTNARNHYSGGNATRFGIFSLLYGLHASLWHQVLAERHGPVLFPLLKQLGYDISIQSCTDLDFPEFRKSAFVDVTEHITDRWGDLPRVERDRAVTDNLITSIESAGEKPFFLFGFYDAPHSSYIYPKEHEKFLPVQIEQDMNFFDIAANCTVENLLPVANRFRNALHYVDAQVGRVTAELERRGLLDRTILIVTGDHGQEFGELGYYGHNTTFSRYQAQTVFVANIPGLPPGPIDRLTSHVDVIPTIFANLGVTAPTSDYSHGVRLDRPSERSHVVVAGWSTLGLVDGNYAIVRGMDTYNLTSEVFDRNYKPVANESEVVAQRRPWLVQLVSDLAAFRR